MDQARGPVLQRPLQVEDSIQFLHQRIRECNACLPYTGDMTPPPPPPRTSPPPLGSAVCGGQAKWTHTKPMNICRTHCGFCQGLCAWLDICRYTAIAITVYLLFVLRIVCTALFLVGIML